MATKKKNYNKPALAYRVLKFFGILMLIWPTDNNGKCFHRIIREICWWLLIFIEIFLFCGVSIGFYNFYNDIPTFTTVIFILLELTVICDIIYTSIFFKVRRLNIKTLISIVENTVYNVNSKEELLFKEYIKSSNLTSLSHFLTFSTIIIFYIYLHLFEPILILPKEIWHPFPIDPFSKKCLVLIQQLIYIIHTGSLNVADGVIFMSMNVAIARFKVLAAEFESVASNFELTKCIRKHQDIIWFVSEINRTMRFIILKTVFTIAFYLICGFLQLVNIHEKLNFFLTYQFTIAILIALYRLYFIAQCADNLSTMSENLRYSIPWVGKSSEISRSMFIIIHRCQRPIGISVSGIIPHFDLKYYGKFLYLTFSYFMTLKAILELKIGF